MGEKTYAAIDLKSFYASVECMDRQLDPMTTHLVVADESRTEKTICLAVSPSMKAYGIGGRPRLFEVVQAVEKINAKRQLLAPGRQFQGKSFDCKELEQAPHLAVDYLVARPKMARYMAISTQIYHIYLRYVAPEDIHVYSIDEVFLDLSGYLRTYGKTAEALVRTMILDVWKETGITATAGIGPNLYLAKVAMDIEAKHSEPDKNGVRIAILTEESYRRNLWTHRPITDFWRVGRGYAKKLAEYGMYTMGDVARCSLGQAHEAWNEQLLFRLFGVNAELLIDHAWGVEPCTMADIKAYRPQSNSLGAGQVLQEPYDYDKAKLVVWEMTDQLALDLVEQGLTTKQLTLTVGYDRENLTDPKRKSQYHGPVTRDGYGRPVPKHAHGTIHLQQHTASSQALTEAMESLFERIVHPALLVRRLTVVAVHVVPEREGQQSDSGQQLSLLTDPKAEAQKQAQREKEKKLQEAMLSIKKKYGKNAVLKGKNLEEGATAMERNGQIGGHKA